MAKRKRSVSLDGLVAELSTLDARRKVVVNQLTAAVRSLGGAVSGVALPFSQAARRGRPVGKQTTKRQGGRKRKMSAAARKRISEAQKKRWAAQNSAAKSD